MQNKRLLVILFIVIILLLIPLLELPFTDEVNWTLFDFVTAGVLLIGTGLALEIAMRKIKKTKVRVAIIAAILAVFFLIWTELAVGIFGSTFSGN